MGNAFYRGQIGTRSLYFQHFAYFRQFTTGVNLQSGKETPFLTSEWSGTGICCVPCFEVHCPMNLPYWILFQLVIFRLKEQGTDTTYDHKCSEGRLEGQQKHQQRIAASYLF